MNEIKTEDFLKYIESLKAPETLEEVKEVIKNDHWINLSLEMTANINALIDLLVDKGIITMKEYEEAYEKSKETILDLIAKKYLNNHNKN